MRTKHAHFVPDELEALPDVGFRFQRILLDERGANELVDGVVGREQVELLDGWDVSVAPWMHSRTR